nr:MAG TPA: hypothetical protein [Caudoviricetes sp.]
MLSNAVTCCKYSANERYTPNEFKKKFKWGGKIRNKRQ